jgi:hypothetical protein
VALLAHGALAAGPKSAQIVARIGPWPVVSNLIAFRGRIWFVNSVTGRNHNSADIYSYAPSNGALRYERHLFSQDAGRPTAGDGWLYWPFEDDRFSLGWGMFSATDGKNWRNGTIPTAQIFHVHAMARLSDGRLLAATSAWRGGLQASSDNGKTWHRIYDHPTPHRRVSRIVDLAAAGERAFASLTGPDERTLLTIVGDEVRDTPGWPGGRTIRGLAAFRGAAYALVGDGRALWRTDGEASVQIGALPGPAWGLAVGPEGLWAIGRQDADYALWRSSDGRDWKPIAWISGGQPFDLVATETNVYIGGQGDDGHGILWALRVPTKLAAADTVQYTPQPMTSSGTTAHQEERNWQAAGFGLETVLLDPASYADRRKLRDLIAELADDGPPAGFFTKRLAMELPQRELSLIGGQVSIPAETLGRWILLWGMARAERGPVPTALAKEPWSQPENSAEKYFAAAPAAMWAIGAMRQCDPSTLAALIARLANPADPLWLTGDVVGALPAMLSAPSPPSPGSASPTTQRPGWAGTLARSSLAPV